MKKVIGFGALNVDNIFKVENLLLAENPAYPIDTQAGGSAANTIIGLAKLGIPCGFVGVVAQDAYGKLLITEFRVRNVDTSKIVIRKTEDSFSSSGLVEAYVDKKGRRILFVKPGVNSSLAQKEIDLNYLNQGSLIHLSSFVDNAQLEIQKAILKKISPEVKISFSPGSIYCNLGLKKLVPILKRTHILFLDKNEIYQLTRKNYKKASEKLLKIGINILVVTLGKKGCFVATKDNQFLTPTRKFKAVDTTGAGDAFATGFLFGLIKNSPLEKCAKIGNAVAGFCIKRLGARTGLPNRKELSSVVSLPK